MRELSINNFKNEVRITYEGEQFLVRDNGAVCRMPRHDQRRRRLDSVWTFGKQCKTHGYRRISKFIVHKIVATAFHGERPSSAHVVDHLDTDRRNNRVENLRWVTRLENMANNPKTLRRIEQIWGSVDEMLRDPNRKEKVEPLSNRSWMPQPFNQTATQWTDTQSFTPLAMQRNWRTPSAFPLCPDEITERPLTDYLAQLVEDSIFSHNKLGEALVQVAEISDDGLFISVITKLIDAVKDWGLAKITFEHGKFVHNAGGTFFTFEGAKKNHYKQLGKLWEGGNNFDDFC